MRPSDSPNIDIINSDHASSRISVWGTRRAGLSDGSDMKFYVDLHAVVCVVKTRKAIAR